MSSQPKTRKPKPFGCRTYATCKHCGKPFITKPSELKRGAAVFCSRACLFQSRREWAEDNARYLKAQNALRSSS